MGLDMLAFTTTDTIDQTIDIKQISDNCVQLHCWRKHPNLHGWMEKLYRERGGTEVFNCLGIKLTLEDLDRLEVDLRNNALPHTEGFFFGQSMGDELEDDLDFVAKAKAAIASGKTVLYGSWW